MNTTFRSSLLTLSVIAIAAAVGVAREPSLRDGGVVAGSPADFLEVRHLVLTGTNEAIGRALAEIARDRHHVHLARSQDLLRTRAQRHYIEKNNPILYERMSGVAAAFGKRLDDDAWNFSGLNYAHLGGGCSVIHFPPGIMADGYSLVSRDYDFSTGTIQGTRSRPGEEASTARPYVIEMHPTRGYASLAICAYDLLSGVVDGINSEGLTVALLADDELTQKFRMEPAGNGGVGLGALQMLRMLLDTCAKVEEAKEALLMTKQYYEFIPVHYIVADRRGHSFVWEYSQAHNREYVIENPGQPLITTNFSLHRYLDGQKPPSAQRAENVCPRYCLLSKELIGKDKLTIDAIKETHHRVDAAGVNAPGSSRAPNRTLWHALYFPEKRMVQVSFYLRDAADPDHPGRTRIERSKYLEFTLDPMK
jgi:hypothetical protein